MTAKKALPKKIATKKPAAKKPAASKAAAKPVAKKAAPAKAPAKGNGADEGQILYTFRIHPSKVQKLKDIAAKESAKSGEKITHAEIARRAIDAYVD